MPAKSKKNRNVNKKFVRSNELKKSSHTIQKSVLAKKFFIMAVERDVVMIHEQLIKLNLVMVSVALLRVDLSLELKKIYIVNS